MSAGFCVYYFLFISLAALVILSYIGFLCYLDAQELRVEERHHHTLTVFIADGAYFVLFLVLIIVSKKKRNIVIPQGYQALDDGIN